MPGKKIMIVDDDVEFLEELKETLCLNDYEVETFSDGNSALRMVRKIKPDVIMLDLKMKGKSGFQVADSLKRFPETANIPVITMTGFYTEKEHASLLNICGIKDCLIKPLNPLELIAKLEAVLQVKK